MNKCFLSAGRARGALAGGIDAAGAGLAACGERVADQVETLRGATPGDFSISLVTKGELRAAESTPIMPPPGSRAPRTIRWLAPNFSWVRRGEVVARFDVSTAEREASTAGLEIDKVDLQVMGKQRELERLLSELGNDLELVDIEKLMAERVYFGQRAGLLTLRDHRCDARQGAAGLQVWAPGRQEGHLQRPPGRRSCGA